MFWDISKTYVCFIFIRRPKGKFRNISFPNMHQVLRQDPEVSLTLDKIRYYHMLKNRQSEVDLNLMPRRGMAYERGVMIVSNPYTEDVMKKYNSMEMLIPRTGEVVHIAKLPQSLYTPGSTELKHGYKIQLLLLKLNFN